MKLNSDRAKKFTFRRSGLHLVIPGVAVFVVHYTVYTELHYTALNYTALHYITVLTAVPTAVHCFTLH